MKRWLLIGAFASSAIHAQNVDKPVGYADLSTLPVPVVAGDITDRPYHVIGHIKADIRKTTVFHKSISDAKAYRELWERGQKMHADAIIHATVGDPHLTAFSAGSVTIRGDAIKFVEP